MKIKIICDRKFFEFVSCKKINDVEVMTIESLTNYKKIYAAIADTNLLFIVTDEREAERISRVAKGRKVDVVLVILREKFELHVKQYVFKHVSSTTVVPYGDNQNEICRKLIQTISDSLAQGKITFEEVKKFFCYSDYFGGNEYFTYEFGDINNFHLECCWGEEFKIEEIVFRTAGKDLYEVMNIKVISKGKRHCTGKMNYLIAYDDIDDLNSDADMKRAMECASKYLFLIVEPDKENLKKYKRLAHLARKYYCCLPQIWLISLPSDESTVLTNAHVNIKTSNIEKFFEDFYKFDRRWKYDDDEISILFDMRKVRAISFTVEPSDDNSEIELFLKDLSARSMITVLNFPCPDDPNKISSDEEYQMGQLIWENATNYCKSLILMPNHLERGSKAKSSVTFYVKED